ncbi:MAG: ArsR/SmtB family transcription factor [Lautropia sp.]
MPPTTVAAADPLDRVFAALADPTRRAIVARLAGGEATVMELAEPFALTQPAISKHLKVLERAGLIARGRVAQTRPCRLQPAPLQQVASWAERYHAEWEARLDRLGEFLDATRSRRPATTATTATTTATPTPRPSTRGRRHDRFR